MNPLPPKFLDMLQKLYPKEFEKILQTFDHPTIPSFRVNTLLATKESVQKQLANEGFQITPVEWYSDAFVLSNRSLRELTQSKVFTQSQIYIQNLSSMIPSLVLDPNPTDTILDIAAAPGSKTSHLAALMCNQGQIIANDISWQRLYKLKQVLSNQSVANTQITNFPGQLIWQKYPEYFDKVLVDTPCSMEGLFKTYSTKTYDHWSHKKVKILSQRQKYLLRSAVTSTKPGGTIVYSTCTISPEENEQVIDWILQIEPQITLENINLSNLPFTPGITQWNKPLNPTLQKTARIIPTNQMEAFFIAKIKKLS